MPTKTHGSRAAVLLA